MCLGFEIRGFQVKIYAIFGMEVFVTTAESRETDHPDFPRSIGCPRIKPTQSDRIDNWYDDILT